MWWHILGVNPNDDEKTIKKAYGKLLRGINQDNEIDLFTKTHQAFRMAMESLKQNELKENLVLKYQNHEKWYLEEMESVYNNPKKRFSLDAWKNIFACMSFSEEVDFSETYIQFFNEHYFLVNDLWLQFEQMYPLKSRKEFKWRELINGNLLVSLDEVKDLSDEEALCFVEHKILAYYAIVDNRFESAYDSIREAISIMETEDLLRWYFIVTIKLSIHNEIENIYQKLQAKASCQLFATIHYAHYLTALKEYKRSNEILSLLKHDTDVSIKQLNYINQYYLSGQLHTEIEQLPWLELDTLSKKDKKALSEGQYHKVIKLRENDSEKNSLKLRLLNFGGRSS